MSAQQIRFAFKVIWFFSTFAETWVQFVSTGEVLLGGYLFHYIPFYFYDRTLFLHHYLPAYVYKIMLTAFVFSHMQDLWSYRMKIISLSFLIVWLGVAIRYFIDYSSLSYGLYPLSAEEVKDLKFKDTWDLIIHKPWIRIYLFLYCSDIKLSHIFSIALLSKQKKNSKTIQNGLIVAFQRCVASIQFRVWKVYWTFFEWLTFDKRTHFHEKISFQSCFPLGNKF